MTNPRRIAIIGNGGGGKTGIALALHQARHLPLHEVDCIQFGPNWSRVPETRVRSEIDAIIDEPEWILDGFGPPDTIQHRFDRADQIIFVDMPLWVHYWWAMKRQIDAHLGAQRVGGPPDCDLRLVDKEMCEALWLVHTEIRPKLLLDLEPHGAKLVRLTSPEAVTEYTATIVPRGTLRSSP